MRCRRGRKWPWIMAWDDDDRKRWACSALWGGFIWRSRRRVGWCETLWGGRRGGAPSPLDQADGGPHASAERPGPVPHCPRPREHADRGCRDEPVELARRGHRPGPGAPPAEEARRGRGGPTEAAGALARGGRQGRAQGHAYCRGFRGWPRRLLAGALAAGPRRRG